MTDQPHHDQQACGNQARTEINQQPFPAPDQIGDVPDRHLDRIRNAGPETERGQKLRTQIQMIFDKKSADNSGQPGDARRHIHHHRRQIRPAHLLREFEYVFIEPAAQELNEFCHGRDMISAAPRMPRLSPARERSKSPSRTARLMRCITAIWRDAMHKKKRLNSRPAAGSKTQYQCASWVP